MPVVSSSASSTVAILFVVLVLSYVVPSVIAYFRRHRRRRTILALNLLTGWTAIGWVVCAVWCSTPNVEVRRTRTVLEMKRPIERRRLAG